MTVFKSLTKDQLIELYKKAVDDRAKADSAMAQSLGDLRKLAWESSTHERKLALLYIVKQLEGEPQ